MKHVGPLTAVLCFLLTACAGLFLEQAPADEAARCVAVFRLVDERVEAAGVGDAEAARIEGFAYLRVNRFLGSFRAKTMSATESDAWIDRLRELDRAARQVELANLPPGERQRLNAALGDLLSRPIALESDLDKCASTLWARDLQDAGLAQLRRVARVPDSYNTWLRLAGFYPLTSLGVAAGFAQWKKEVLPSFDRDPGSLPIQGALDLYRPTVLNEEGRRRTVRRLSAEAVAKILQAARGNPLGIPEPQAADLGRLVESFAPVWRIDRTGDADRIGQPLWATADGKPYVAVDPARPVGFTRLSHVRFGDEILPQISYVIWFKERPKRGRFDLLAGALDAVIWRVTIGMDGRPLLYDSIHACGCYHLFFPVPPTARRTTPEDQDLREEALVPALAPRLAEGQAITIHLTSGSHYIVAVTAEPAEPAGRSVQSYDLLPPGAVPDLALRSAAMPAEGGGGRRSIYGIDGLVAGSERLERLLLWPMGIASAGAIRQWGHHATAFVGRRHFDDPHLLSKAFRR